MTDDLLSTKKTWLSAHDLARELSIPKSSVYTMAAAGVFGHPLRLGDKKGSTLRFHRADVIRSIIASREKMAIELGL